MKKEVSIDRTDVSWVVVVDGEIVHEAASKERAKNWAEENDTEPDRIASKAPLEAPIRL